MLSDVTHDNLHHVPGVSVLILFFFKWLGGECCVADGFLLVVRLFDYTRPVAFFVDHCSRWRTDNLPFWTDTPWTRQDLDQDCLPLHLLVLSRF